MLVVLNNPIVYLASFKNWCQLRLQYPAPEISLKGLPGSLPHMDTVPEVSSGTVSSIIVGDV
jgi:hypothetical protein